MAYIPVTFCRDAAIIHGVQRKAEAQPRQEVIGLCRAVGLERQALERRNQRQREFSRSDARGQAVVRERVGDGRTAGEQQKGDADDA